MHRHPHRIGRALLAVLLAAAGLVATGAAPAAAADEPARIEGWLQDRLAGLGPDEEVLVLVGASSASTARAAIDAAGAAPFRSFEKVGFSSALLTAAQVDRVAAFPGVDYLQGNRSLAPTNETATQATRVQQAEDLWADLRGTDLDGRGVGIAIVDSGMAGDHPMFRDAADTGTRLLNIKQSCVVVTACATPGEVEDTFFIDATGTDTDLAATGGHGTHVTAIAGGAKVTTSVGDETRGVAPAASLYGLGAGAAIFVLNASAGVNWVLEHHADPCGAFTPAPAVVGGCAPIKVVNMSFGGSCGTGESYCTTNEYDPDDIYVRLSEALVLEGVVPVWAAGNGADINDTDPPPNDGTESLTNNPGQSPLPGVLMVANYNDGDVGDRNASLAPSSSRGRQGFPETYPDISAPGTNILAACRAWLPICSSGYGDPDYGAITGTSMAAPHIAGIVALLFQAEPDLSPAMIEDVLEDTAHTFGDPDEYEADVAVDGALPGGTRNGNHLTHFAKGHGLVDAVAALADVTELEDPGFTGVSCPAVDFATDPTGDATGVAGLANVPPEANDPNFDITQIATQLREDEGVVRFLVTLDDVADSVSASTGEYIRFSFSYGTFNGQMTLSRDLDNGTEEFRLLVVNGIGDTTTIAAGLVGAFDAEADVIHADLPVDALVDNAAVSPMITEPFAAGDVLTGIDVLVQRQVGTSASGGATLTADQATGGCPFVLGAAPPPVVPEGSPALLLLGAAGVLGLAVVLGRRRQGAAALAVLVLVAGLATTAGPAGADVLPGATFTERDNTTARSFTIEEPNADQSCVDTSTTPATVTDGPGCFQVPISFAITDPTLDIQFIRATAAPTGPDADLTDLDIYVLDADGAVVTTAAGLFGPAGSPVEVAFRQVPPDGDYIVVVSAYQNLPGATFDLTIDGFAREPFVD